MRVTWRNHLNWWLAALLAVTVALVAFAVTAAPADAAPPVCVPQEDGSADCYMGAWAGVITKETGGDNSAIGYCCGERGLFQFLSTTFNWVASQNGLDQTGRADLLPLHQQRKLADWLRINVDLHSQWSTSQWYGTGDGWVTVRNVPTRVKKTTQLGLLAECMQVGRLGERWEGAGGFVGTKVQGAPRSTQKKWARLKISIGETGWMGECKRSWQRGQWSDNVTIYQLKERPDARSN